MPDVYTSTSTVPNLVTAAYDRYMRLALRSMPQFRAFADTRAVDQTHPGSSVIFTLYSDLADATSSINEITDPEIVQIPDPSRVTVTLGEYGNYTVLTKRLEAFSLDAAVDTNAANMIAYNMASSVDKIVQAVIAGTTQVVTEEGGSLVSTSNAVNSITASDTAKARDFRYAVTKLRSGNIVPNRGELYAAVVHPSVAHDLRIETGSTGWRAPHEYVDPVNIYAGEIGTFEGALFVETPRCTTATNSGSVKYYNSYVMGQEALAEAVASEFGVVVGGSITDPLNRKMALGWTGIAGWSLFRTAANSGTGAAYKIQTAATVN